jgi:pimeloyl-ACP methyl ester carboxylesterase
MPRADVPSIRHEWVDVGDARLHCAVAGHGERLMLLLHGFPDCWHGWVHQLAHFSGRFTVVAPDGRGCNLSDKPESVAAYRLPRLVADADSLVTHFGGGRPAVVVGHDWGGVVAWTLASSCPDAVSHLVVLNAPHPAVLARALVADSQQQQASGYLERLRQPGAESRLSENRFERLRWVLDIPTIPGEVESAYVAASVEAWSRPGALTGALNWYRANDFGPLGRAAEGVPTEVEVPALVIWGRDDRALLPHLALQHRDIAKRLTVHVLEGAGHWTARERPDEVNALIDAHCSS